LSVPSIVSGKGILKIVQTPFPEKELLALHRSADALTQAISTL
jgi:malate/lactate dehydrogenase